MGEIARQADMSRASLYRHFASKEELIGAWTLREIERLFDELDTSSESLSAAIASAVEWLREHPVFGAVAASNDQGMMRTTLQSGSALDMGSELVRDRTGADAVSAEILVRLVVSLVEAPTEDLSAVAEALASRNC